MGSKLCYDWSPLTKGIPVRKCQIIRFVCRYNPAYALIPFLKTEENPDNLFA
jgi:hypothetical protein